jgi:hypothetical protein
MRGFAASSARTSAGIASAAADEASRRRLVMIGIVFLPAFDI